MSKRASSLPRPVGRRFVLQQAHLAAPRGGVRGDRQPARHDSHEGDVDCVLPRSVESRSPAILRGPLLGGSLITAAGTDDRGCRARVRRGLAPDEEESRRASRKKSRSRTSSPTSRSPTGASGLLRDGIGLLRGDLTDEEKELVWGDCDGASSGSVHAEVERVAWRTKPSAYVVAANDRTVTRPGTVRRQANGRHDVRGRRAGHVPMLSQPTSCSSDPQPRNPV